MSALDQTRTHQPENFECLDIVMTPKHAKHSSDSTPQSAHTAKAWQHMVEDYERVGHKKHASSRSKACSSRTVSNWRHQMNTLFSKGAWQQDPERKVPKIDTQSGGSGYPEVVCQCRSRCTGEMVTAPLVDADGHAFLSGDQQRHRRRRLGRIVRLLQRNEQGVPWRWAIRRKVQGILVKRSTKVSKEKTGKNCAIATKK